MINLRNKLLACNIRVTSYLVERGSLLPPQEPQVYYKYQLHDYWSTFIDVCDDLRTIFNAGAPCVHCSMNDAFCNWWVTWRVTYWIILFIIVWLMGMIHRSRVLFTFCLVVKVVKVKVFVCMHNYKWIKVNYLVSRENVELLLMHWWSCRSRDR